VTITAADVVCSGLSNDACALETNMSTCITNFTGRISKNSQQNQSLIDFQNIYAYTNNIITIIQYSD
jgi:hypothetical protein